MLVVSNSSSTADTLALQLDRSKGEGLGPPSPSEAWMGSKTTDSLSPFLISSALSLARDIVVQLLRRGGTSRSPFPLPPFCAEPNSCSLVLDLKQMCCDMLL